MEKLQVTDLNSEKEYLLSKINSVNDLLKTNSENLDNKIKEIRLDYLEFKESGMLKKKEIKPIINCLKMSYHN